MLPQAFVNGRVALAATVIIARAVRDFIPNNEFIARGENRHFKIVDLRIIAAVPLLDELNHSHL